MRISEVIQLALDSMGFVIFLGILLLLGWLISYKILYQKILGGTKKIQIKKLGRKAVFFCYIVVVLSATMLSRPYGVGGFQLTPFASYRQAWNGFSVGLWRNIILNIAMFVPFGFFLPFLWEKAKKYWVTYLAGLGFTLFIELTQFITGTGIFEADDIINNFYGAIIGFGFYQIAETVWLIWKKQSVKKKRVLLAQVPLVVAVICFSGIFLFYQQKELGNLSFAYTERVNMAKVQVELEANLQETMEEAAVYQLHVASKEETTKIAETLFAKAGTEVDYTATDFYDETVIYHSMDGNCMLWIDYQGSKMDYTNYAMLWQDEEQQELVLLQNATREQVEEILEENNISLPDKAEFEEVESGIYFFSADKLVDDGVLHHGRLQVQLSEDKEIVTLENNLITYQYWKSYPIRSEREAYNDFLAGKFQAGWKQDFSRVVVKDVKLQYWTDTKGYFQPVYSFQVSLDGDEGIIYLKAIED